MIIRRSIALVLLLVAGCGPVTTAPAPITLRDGDPGPTTFAGGRYVVTWSAESCEAFSVEVAPTTGGAPIPVPSSGATVTIPAGRAYVNRGGSCTAGYSVTLAPAP